MGVVSEELFLHDGVYRPKINIPPGWTAEQMEELREKVNESSAVHPLGLEREVYEEALKELRDSVRGCMVSATSNQSLPYDYNHERVELAKWIVCNIWAPRD